MRLCALALATTLLRVCGSAAPETPAPAGPGSIGSPAIAQPPAPLPGPGSVPPNLIQPFAPGAELPPSTDSPAPAAVTSVTEGPHGGTLVTTAAARFEIAATDDGLLTVWVTDSNAADVPTSRVALPILRFDLPEGQKIVVLRPVEGTFEGTIEARPGPAAVVSFDAAVDGVVLAGITATMGPPSTAGDATPVAAEAPAAAEPPAEEAPAPVPVAEAPAPAEAPPRAVTKAPPSGWRPGKRGPQAQTFAPSPLAPSPPVRGNVVTGTRP
ncbi:MAG: hypothetical protein HYY06_04845 [Deltaproteobacteria bacterium]|nr:hypothetical protein [Deltaproteobacteria bacterium]